MYFPIYYVLEIIKCYFLKFETSDVLPVHAAVPLWPVGGDLAHRYQLGGQGRTGEKIIMQKRTIHLFKKVSSLGIEFAQAKQLKRNFQSLFFPVLLADCEQGLQPCLHHGLHGMRRLFNHQHGIILNSFPRFGEMHCRRDGIVFSVKREGKGCTFNLVACFTPFFRYTMSTGFVFLVILCCSTHYGVLLLWM